MGGGASRAAARRTAVALKPTEDALQSIQHLPADSAVRRDAEAALEMERKRVELETIEVPLEELSGKDEHMVELMKSAMKRPDGEITYRAHVLPLPEQSQMLSEMELQVEIEQQSTQKLYAAREASENPGQGRITHEQLLDVMKHIQSNRGDTSEHTLAGLSKEYSCDLEVLRSVAKYYSMPRILTEALGENYQRTATWQ